MKKSYRIMKRAIIGSIHVHIYEYSNEAVFLDKSGYLDKINIPPGAGCVQALAIWINKTLNTA